MSSNDYQPTELERPFVAALKAQDMPRIRTLIDAGALSLDDLEHYKTCMERVLDDFEWRLDCCSFEDLMIYIDHLVPKQKQVIAMLVTAIDEALDQQRHEPDPKEWNEGTCEKCGCLTPYCIHCGRTWCVGCESPHCQA